MGICESCFGGSSYNVDENPETMEERRLRMLEAAEKRQKDQEGRGLQNPERVKQKQRQMEELEKKQEMSAAGGGGGGGLKWQVN